MLVISDVIHYYAIYINYLRDHMNRLQTAGAAVALGVTTYGSLAISLDHLTVPTEEHNARVAACATELGRTAMDRAILPPACTDFEQAFARTSTTVQAYSPETRTMEAIERSVAYHLPAQAEFKKDSIITAEQEQRSEDVRSKMALSVSLLGALGFYGMLRLSNRMAGYNEQQ